MKLRYRITSNGYYVPQGQLKNGEWKDFVVANVIGELNTIAYSLGKESGYSGNIWHFKPKNKTDKLEEMSVFFESELKVAAFLGAAKVFFSDRTKEIDF